MLFGKGVFSSIGSESSCSIERLSKTESVVERTRGLLDRAPLKTNEGLWISPCNSVHTFGMKYTIDLVYLDRKQNIKKIVSSVKPYRMSFCIFAKSIIELADGTAEELTLMIGQKMDWVKTS